MSLKLPLFFCLFAFKERTLFFFRLLSPSTRSTPLEEMNSGSPLPTQRALNGNASFFASVAADVAAAADEERRTRTLVIKGAPIGLTSPLAFELLFGDAAALCPPAQVCEGDDQHHSTNISALTIAGEPYLCVRSARRNVVRVRLEQPPKPYSTYTMAFVEFATRDVANAFLKSFNGRDMRDRGGDVLHIEVAKRAICGERWWDYDLVTQRPCLYGLSEEEVAAVDWSYNFT